LPNGLPQTLPPFSRWAISTLTNRAYDRIYGDGVNYGTIDSFGGRSSNGKGLGNPSSAPGSCECGDPISAGTGNLFEQIADYQTADRTTRLTRYYNSLINPTRLPTA
jgi:hypothetical protein